MSTKFWGERSLDMGAPLLILTFYLTYQNQGFPSFTPVIAATVYALIQPFFRFFIFDQLRASLFANGHTALFFAGVGVVYSALAIVIARCFA